MEIRPNIFSSNNFTLRSKGCTFIKYTFKTAEKLIINLVFNAKVYQETFLYEQSIIKISHTDIVYCIYKNYINLFNSC